MKLNLVLLSSLLAVLIPLTANANPRWCSPNCPPVDSPSADPDRRTVTNRPLNHRNTHVRVYRVDSYQGLIEANRGGARFINQENRQYIHNNGIHGVQRRTVGY